MWYISYWFWPVFSALVWAAMLITMLVVWATDGYPKYPSMEQTQTIAYISDIGAQGLKPFFITMSTITVVSFNVNFILERWLRHTGRLAPNTSVWQKIWSLASVIAAIAGGVGLILVTVFDTLHHPRKHRVFLGLFIGGYIVSAIFICWEYQRLGYYYRSESILRYSFWIKLFFIIVEVALAIAFGVAGNQKKYNVGAVLEWVIAFIFFFYVLSFLIDFMPAVRHKGRQSRATEMDVALAEGGDQMAAERGYFRGGAAAQEHGNGYTNGYMNGHANGDTNGHLNAHKPPAPAAVPPSRNF
ncbi:uncharacterized protein EI97DRAFT_9963 [Westerdykella ornata]|uniref:CWH43-like N-terminal domain-containing protein n=1 Tax=Westerdykella ornata TaxID=318751 RepID=A0A6A6JYL7_WESOR|nr:uncharacterized protein EI97DRAFT_9963 [Westerdykella ornata]KAF2280846.1 hypothetical protein EI97DRAFT_9963 [Westerdykella ornata]